MRLPRFLYWSVALRWTPYAATRSPNFDELSSRQGMQQRASPNFRPTYGRLGSCVSLVRRVLAAASRIASHSL